MTYVISVSVLIFVIVFQSLIIVQQRYYVSELRENLFEKENRNKLLIENIEKTDSEQYIEEVARQRLGMVKSNEIPIKVEEVTLNSQERTNINKKLQSKDKIGIYMKDWYIDLENWFEESKK